MKNLVASNVWGCILVLLLAITIIVATAHVSQALQWSTETIDDFAGISKIPLIGGYCQGFSSALDSSGKPHIVYKTVWISDQRANFRLSYATKTDGLWQIENIEPPNVGPASLSIAVDASGTPHVAYAAGVFASNGSYHDEIRYAVRNNGSWNIEIIDQGVGGSSIAVDAAGNPHIAWGYGVIRSGRVYSQLKYATKSGGVWSMETPDMNTGSRPSIAVDAAGNPHIIYTGDLRGDKKYAVKRNDSWNIESIDRELGLDAPLLLDAAGNPHIVSLNAGGYSGTLWHGIRSNGVWRFEAVDKDAGTLDSGYSFALDSSGSPHILYHKGVNLPDQRREYQGLRYATKVNGSWVIEDVASGELDSSESSITLDRNGKPHIVYCEEEPSQGLKYAVGYTGQLPSQPNITTTARTISTFTVRNASITTITTISSTPTTTSSTISTSKITATSTNELTEPAIYTWIAGAAVIAIATVSVIVLLRKRMIF